MDAITTVTSVDVIQPSDTDIEKGTTAEWMIRQNRQNYPMGQCQPRGPKTTSTYGSE